MAWVIAIIPPGTTHTIVDICRLIKCINSPEKNKQDYYIYLGGGFNFSIFTHTGEMIQFDEHIFQMG